MCLIIDGRETGKFRQYYELQPSAISDFIKIKKVVAIRDTIKAPFRDTIIQSGILEAKIDEYSSFTKREEIQDGAIHCLMPHIVNRKNCPFVMNNNEYIIDVTASIDDFIAIGSMSTYEPSTCICFKKINIPESELNRIKDLYQKGIQQE